MKGASSEAPFFFGEEKQEQDETTQTGRMIVRLCAMKGDFLALGVGQDGSAWNKTSGVQNRVTPEVVMLDMIKRYSGSDEGMIHQFTNQPPQSRILINVAKVRLEMHIIDGVESHESGKKGNIRQGETLSHEIGMFF